MDYQNTLKWMFSQLPMYQNKGSKALKKTLTPTIKFLDYLKNPHLDFKSLHIGGTNGKGSVSHMTASILQEAGYKVGLYTSPHLKDFRERIKLNGQCCSKDFVIRFIKENQLYIEKNQLSFFEFTVCMAFQYFAQNKVDIAIIEVGLGGRLDSTNVIQPLASVITNIGWDHMDVLGNSLKEIASEKAGIIKSKTPIIIGKKQKESAMVFQEMALQQNAPVIFSENENLLTRELDLKGVCQQENAQTVETLIHLLSNKGFYIHETHLIDGLLNTIKNTGFKGRWQILNKTPLIVCDTAHNKDGINAVMKQIEATDYKKLHIVWGMVKEKNTTDILPLLPANAMYYLSEPNIPRALSINQLALVFKNAHLEFRLFNSVSDAFNSAKENASKDDMIFVGGSTFVVAEIV